MPTDLIIISYQPRYQAAFMDLNRAWIEQYFTMEPEDEACLRDPEGYFIHPGGQVFFVLDQEEAIATAALKPIEGGFELCKMAVKDGQQGRGVGRALLNHCRDWATARGAQQLWLQSNAKLRSAMQLYEKAGFQYLDMHTQKADYQRADVAMRLTLPANPQ